MELLEAHLRLSLQCPDLHLEIFPVLPAWSADPWEDSKVIKGLSVPQKTGAYGEVINEIAMQYIRQARSTIPPSWDLAFETLQSQQGRTHTLLMNGTGGITVGSEEMDQMTTHLLAPLQGDEVASVFQISRRTQCCIAADATLWHQHSEQPNDNNRSSVRYTTKEVLWILLRASSAPRPSRFLATVSQADISDIVRFLRLRREKGMREIGLLAHIPNCSVWNGGADHTTEERLHLNVVLKSLLEDPTGFPVSHDILQRALASPDKETRVSGIRLLGIQRASQIRQAEEKDHGSDPSQSPAR